jgi:hypothetical protein
MPESLVYWDHINNIINTLPKMNVLLSKMESNHFRKDNQRRIIDKFIVFSELPSVAFIFFLVCPL